jgi:hypothetical protein
LSKCGRTDRGGGPAGAGVAVLARGLAAMSERFSRAPIKDPVFRSHEECAAIRASMQWLCSPRDPEKSNRISSACSHPHLSMPDSHMFAPVVKSLDHPDMQALDKLLSECAIGEPVACDISTPISVINPAIFLNNPLSAYSIARQDALGRCGVDGVRV